MFISEMKPGWLTPKDSKKIRSQMVILAPGKSVGEHVTHDREEVIFILEGQALYFESGSSTEVKAGSAIYVPPETSHNLKNPGPGELKYVYVVALHEGPDDHPHEH